MKTPSVLAALAGIATLKQVKAYFILQGAPLVVERIDPIVSPRKVASHVHNIVGANNIDMSSTFESLQKSTCTTLPVTKDLSAYWQPQLYYYNPTNQTYQVIPSYSKIYYLNRNGPKGGNLTAFPEGFRMVAGNPMRSSFNPDNKWEKAINYVCQDYDGGHQGDPEWADRYDFFKHQCKDGLRAQVVFPACWDGINLYKSDGSHMSYPVGQEVNNGDCPTSHPVHFTTLFQEFVYDVGKFPFNEEGPTWVFATGDATGYSLHADFQNGWDVPLLQQAIDQCTGDIGGGLQNCPPLAPYLNSQAAAACRIAGDLIDEDVGLNKPISKLPGCNPLYTSGPRPSGCTDTSPVPDTKPSKSTPAEGYTYQACVAEAPNGRLLTGASMTSDSMTGAVCTKYCSDKGFEYAGVEYGRECYCGSEFRNGGSGASITASTCSSKCPGNPNEDCGGGSALSLYRNPAKATPALKLPAGWSSAGCVADGVNNARTLSGYTFASSNMTLERCVNACSDRKYTYAGVEYASECYCSNEPTTLQESISCNMGCSGDARYTCGGPNALSLFTTSHGVASGYSYTGCVAEGSTGRLLTGASTTSDSMTPMVCTKFCSAKGLQYSGIEYGRECYCGNSFVNGGSDNLISESQCGVKCSGDNSQACGGHSTLSLYTNKALAPKAASLPSGWSAVGCISDKNTNGRTLAAYSFVSDSMTYTSCLSGCQARNYTLAGVEYGRECWCANSMLTEETSSQCSMACAGDATRICGGPDALTAFKYNTSLSKRRSINL